MQKAVFHPAALEKIKSFPKDIREKIGNLIFELQMGNSLGMPDSKPMKSILSGD